MRLPSLPAEARSPGSSSLDSTRSTGSRHRDGTPGDPRWAHPDGRPTWAATRRSARASPGTACRSAWSPTTRRSPSCSSTCAASAREWGVTLIPWRNLRGIFGVLRRGELLGLLVDWGYRSDGIPVRLFDAWTTLPAGPATLAAKTGARILPHPHQPRRRTTRSTSPVRRADRGPAERSGRAPAGDPGDRRRCWPTRSAPPRTSGTASSRCGRRAPPRRPTSSGARSRCRPGSDPTRARARGLPRDEADQVGTEP